MLYGAIGVLLILMMAICNLGNVSEKSSKNLQEYYRENPYAKDKNSY